MVFELLNPELKKLVDKRFKEPTLPEKLAFPPILEGKNVLLISATGSGKTEACMLPIFHLLMKEKSKPISVLYITPLKSLNRDLLERLIWWCNQLDLEISVRHGDTSPYERKLQTEFPPQLLVSTLETLQPILVGKRIREHLKNVKHVIIDECLPYDTLVDLENGKKIKIGELVEMNLKTNEKDVHVQSFDSKTGNTISSKVTRFHKIPRHSKMISIITKFYKAHVTATTNHPFLVIRNNKLGWINASEIKSGDSLVVNPELNYDDGEKLISNNEQFHDTILDVNSFREVYKNLFYTGNKNQETKLDVIIEKFKTNGLLPLTFNNKNLQILSRIIGHVLGDGWLTITEDTVATGFSSTPLNLEIIKSDLNVLGFLSSNVQTRKTESVVKTWKNNRYSVKGTSNSVANGSKSLAALLVALGVPRGDKTNVVYEIPRWILNSSSDVKKQFLSAYLGSEISLPSGRPYNYFDVSRISIYKREDLIESGLKYAKQLVSIFSDFGIVISDISVYNGNIRKDGTKSKKIVLTFSNKEQNIINFHNRIGISYSKEKELEFDLIGEYLNAKKFARQNKLLLINKIKELRNKGLSFSKIGKSFGFDKKHGKRQTDYIRGLLKSTSRLVKNFPSFAEWKKTIIGECLIDEVDYVTMDEGKEEFVYDITVEGTHNFIANNIVVHNCHEIVDSKRGVQLAIALERLRELCQRDFQLIMLSATVGEPEKVAQFFSEERKVEIIKAVTAKQFNIQVINPQVTREDRIISEKIYVSPEIAARIRSILDLVNSSRSTLTFTNTREFAEVLASRIKLIDSTFPSGIHHSSLSKDVRIKTEKDFKQEKLKTIISTSSLQLGIDIGSVDLVLQYMSPRQISQLIQRVGRAGHGMERISRGIIISTDDDDIFESAVIARKALNEELEDLRFHYNSLDVLAHQIVGMTFDWGRIEKEKIFNFIKKVYPYKNLEYKDFLEVCTTLEKIGLIFLDSTINKKRRGLEYYFSQISTIPDVRQYKIINSIDNSFVGVLDDEFLALHGENGTTFVVKGEMWKIISVDNDRVMVEPARDIEAAIPGWEGELIPVPYQVAQEVGNLRGFISEKFAGRETEKEIMLSVQEKYPVDENCARKMVELLKKQVKFGNVPTDKKILIEDFENLVVIHTCQGSMANETIGRFLVSLLTSRLGSVGLKVDPYRIMINFNQKNLELLKETIFKTNPDDLRSYLELSLTGSELFQYKFIQVAKRFGAISRDVQLGKINMKKIVEEYVGSPIYRETLNELETEKLDIQRSIEFLKDVQTGKIKVVFEKGLSPIGRIGVKHQFAEIIGPEKPEVEIYEIFKKRLLGTKVRIACLNCGEWDQTYFVGEIPKNLKCKKCEAKLLATLNPNNMDILETIKKKTQDKELTQEQVKNFLRARRNADLFLIYGKKACICLAARGVGPETTIRILAKYHSGEEDLLRDILAAERLYLRTKKFWAI